MIPNLDRVLTELSTVLEPLDLELFAQICGSGVTDGIPWIKLLNGDMLFGYSRYQDTYYKDRFDRHRAAFESVGLTPATFGAAFDAVVSYTYENCDFPRVARKSNFIPKGGVVLDVGVRAGHFLVKASRLAGPEGRVIGIDASDLAERYCRLHKEANRCDNVEFVRAVVGASDGETVRFFHGSPGESMSGFYRETIGLEGRPVVSASHHSGSIETTTRTLDSLALELGLKRCDLVILQINGAEVAAVRGMTRILNDLRPTLFVTCFQRPPGGEEPAAAVLGWVEDIGYEKVFHQNTDMVLRPLD
ncbi:MAG TPA: FkbM family methyltransferase [Vicinamibacterales bacterium]|nr:FkbM family methyltransferase [Vicinamibacterales bacterium]